MSLCFCRRTGAKAEKGTVLNMKTSGRFGNIVPLPAGKYPVPEILPPVACHPRLLVRSGELPELRHKLDMTEYTEARREFETLLSTPYPEKMTIDEVRSGRALGVIEAKAYCYLLSGDTSVGLDALDSIKKYIEAASFDGLADDYRAMGQTMFTAAEVYDWCNPLLSDEDKYFIVAAIENKIAPNMEIGMPPCRYGVVVGHQAEAQLLRDWLSFSIAVYDDFPDIYEFVGGRFFSMYVPVRNYWYASEAFIQGSSYSGYRFAWDLWSAWIFRKMTGKLVYSEKMKTIPAQWIMYRRPDGEGIRDGDDYAELGGRWDQYGFAWFLAGNLFRDPVYLHQAFSKIGKRNRFFYNELTLTPVQMMLFDDVSVGTKESFTDYPTVKYYPDPCGLTIARTGWDIGPQSRDVMAFMKIGGYWSANHHHMDFGAFQIFYRGILASDSGAYVHYGSPHDMSYNKQTIAHNCLLVYDPDETNGKAVNSGGQLMIPGEILDLDYWTDESRGYKMGDVYAHDENPDCTFISGDITKAYGKKVKQVIRRMAFIPTSRGSVHAVFAVSDRVVSSDASFKKTSMLHCQQEPEIHGDTVIIRRTGSPESYHGMKLDYNGMLVSRTLLPENAVITSLGGEGREFMINGENYPIPYNGKLRESAETGWGRVEISPATQNEEDEFFNIMLVCDNGDIPADKSVLCEDSDTVGAVVCSEAVFFSRGKEKISRDFSIDTSASPDSVLNYHICGLEGGKWSAMSGDICVCTADVQDVAATMNFKAPAGKLRFVRCE